MADPNNISQYKYAAMSNLVLQHDKRFSTRRNDEVTGDPESLAGRINIRDMGSRDKKGVMPKYKSKTADLKHVERGGIRDGEDMLEREQKKRKRGEVQQLQGAGILSAADALVEGLRYRPRTPTTRQTYELILTTTANQLGDVSHEVIRSAADAVLEYLKDEHLKDIDRKREIDDLLGSGMSSKEFNELVNLGKKITDYEGQEDDSQMGNGDGVGDDGAELDEKQGVAVVFDDEEEDEEGIAMTREVKDEAEPSSDDDIDDISEVFQPDLQVGNGAEGESEVDLQGGEDLVVEGKSNVSQQDRSAKAEDIQVRDIDAYWLQRQIGDIYNDAHDQQIKTQQALQILSGVSADGEQTALRDIENGLMELFEYENHEIVERLIMNRDKVVWVTRWKRAAEDAKGQAVVERQMVEHGHREILDDLHGRHETGSNLSKKLTFDLMEIDVPQRDQAEKQDFGKGSSLTGGLKPKKLINLDNLMFDQGNHLMTNPNVKLPQGSTKRTFKGYEEIHVPAPRPRKDSSDLMPTAHLPEWAQSGFGSSKHLNRIQTKCFPSAFRSDDNMLICAPTGSGKTNVAMLAILRAIGNHRNAQTGEIMLDEFKIVYIAPLKALVQEQQGNFGKRLAPYGIKVSELTGDRQLTKQQIADTQIIVTTPEKWDVITRKATDMSYTNLVRLIIIDEIHLLHDDRGPVLESIISRTIRKTEQTGMPVRLVGLSATLPNYKDVANFLRVDPTAGLFHFDGSYRPCPLRQEFIGVTEKKAIKQLKTMNDVCYTKVIEQVGTNKQQLLIFVHSRKETAKTAKYIRDKALEQETIGQILRSDAASREVLTEESAGVSDKDLKDIMSYGIGIHHAGMSRADRSSVEDLFADGMLQVLVCTATLAWGVNLPAHTVIIKGTQIYSPEKGSWVELSPQDVLQMLGRAGRPQYDTFGEGIIITTQTEIQYYLSLLNQQLPIESQLVSKLADNLNAEIVLGNVRNRDEGVEWLGYTYLFVRMLRSPGLYSVGADYEGDAALEQKRVDLIHSAATILEKASLVKYDKNSGELKPTELGRIASHYYITYSSMMTYNHHIQPMITPIELFRIFALSDEFKYIPVRQDEKLELAKLLGRVPIPVKESIEEPQAKINVLLQAYISRLRLDGLALMADLVYVTQSAGRILRAIFEICLKKGWSSVAKTALDLCKMAEKRMWPTMSPLRQFQGCPKDIIQKAEKIDVPWPAYFDLDPPRMGELLGLPKMGKTICNLVSTFPRLEVQAQIQPVTRSMLKVELAIAPNFEWDDSVHGLGESFWIFVEDCDGEDILHSDTFLLRKDYVISEVNEHIVEFTVPITEPMPPNYFISLLSDRWLQCETKIAVSFERLILPERFPAHTSLHNLSLASVNDLKRDDFKALYPRWTHFNKVQTQVFGHLFTSNENVFVGAPTGSGKTICAEFAILRLWSSNANGRIVYIAPFQELIDHRLSDWQPRFQSIDSGKRVLKLTGDTIADLKLLERGHLILATPTQWDLISRQWQRRKNVQSVQLFIADEIHMIGGQAGHIYEIIVSRMHYMALQTENSMRIIGLGVPLANARDVAEWIGATSKTTYNFSPAVRPVQLELHIQSFNVPHYPSLMLAMAKPTYAAILQYSMDQPALIFVPSRSQARATALDLLTACVADDDDDRFLHADMKEVEPLLLRINEKSLSDSISHGIGFYHEALSVGDKRIVSHLFSAGALQVMIASRDSCWEIDCVAHLVIIMGTQFYEGREHRYIDYPISEVLQMLGRACRPLEDQFGKGVLLLPATKREYYKKFMYEALPVESNLQACMHDAFVPEISTRIIQSTQDAVDWATYTYFYRRLLSNPSYYGLSDTSHEGLSAHLSELVESTLKDLSEAKIIELDEDDDSLTALNPAMIAAYYNISFITMQTFLLSLTSRTKLKGILEIVTSATEFETIQIRRHEEQVLRRIYDRIPVKMAQPLYDSPHFKAFVLLQAHFSRMQLPSDLAKDQEIILSRILSLLSGCVDVLSSDGHLNAMNAMEMSQMVVQAMWDRDSPLKQIPYFADEAVRAVNRAGAHDVFEFMDLMDPSENKDYPKLVEALGLDNKQLSVAASFTNDRYPNVELDFHVEDPDSVASGQAAILTLSISRETNDVTDGELDTSVHAPFFPQKKVENWWIIIGEEATKSLLAIKRVNIGRKLDLKLEFTPQRPGRQDLQVFLMSDSYVGVDQDPSFTIDVAEGIEEDEADEEAAD